MRTQEVPLVLSIIYQKTSPALRKDCSSPLVLLPGATYAQMVVIRVETCRWVVWNPDENPLGQNTVPAKTVLKGSENIDISL